MGLTGTWVGSQGINGIKVGLDSIQKVQKAVSPKILRIPGVFQVLCAGLFTLMIAFALFFLSRNTDIFNGA